MEQKKLDKKIEANLFSANTATVISTLETLKERGNNAYLPLLFDLLNSKPEPEIEKEIVFILYNLKTKDAAPILVEAIQNPKYLPIRKELTAACWENGLDYKNYLPVFVDLIINDDWETGFEAFTVIENMENYPEQDIIDIATEKIHLGLDKANEKQKYFLHEILTLIR
jgi:hypothetical protein